MECSDTAAVNAAKRSATGKTSAQSDTSSSTRIDAMLALKLIVERNSIRSASRITGLHRNTIMRLIVDAGAKCEELLAARVRNVPVRDVQADEIWTYVGKKEGHKNPCEGDDMYLGD